MPKPKPLHSPQPSRREQVETSTCSPTTIMLHPHFARGLDDIRAGRSFADDVHDHYWAYERGRLFGAIAPSSMPLFDGKRLNPKAVRLFIAARELIPEQENQVARYRADCHRTARRTETSGDRHHR